MFFRANVIVFLSVMLFGFGKAEAVAQNGLQTFENCQLIETDWADGDSFLVKPAEGKQFTLRLYGADCLESHVHDDTDARRLRGQRRYFGISKFGGSAGTSITEAKRLGKAAGDFVVAELKEPFTVITSFADARGDGRYKRYYGFITTSKGHDLAEELVRNGLARAFGVNRSTIDGRSREELKEHLKDVEFQAAIRSVGVWKDTDWESLPDERRLEREEAAELDLAKGVAAPLDPGQKISLNLAARDELIRLPGIGDGLANRLIEGRPYKSVDSVIEVDGIGAGKLAKIRPFLKLE